MYIRITFKIFNIFYFFNKIKGVNMWIITCGKRHDLGRLKGSDGLFHWTALSIYYQAAGSSWKAVGKSSSSANSTHS